MRFNFLDAQRGLAAFAVVAGHLYATQFIDKILPNSFLAVDFFFILSGFVIAHAYQSRLGDDLTRGSFAIKRIIRLYPLALFGAFLGIAVILMKYLLFPDRVPDLQTILSAASLNALLLPNLVSGAEFDHETFPINGPLWTLSLEMAINLIWVFFLIRLRPWVIGLIMVLAAMAIAYGYLTRGPVNLGWTPETYVYGWARVTFGFVAGLLIYKLRARNFALPLSGGLVFALTSTALFASFYFAGGVLNTFYTLVLYPYLVLAMSYYNTDSKAMNWLGEISYPLYVIHFPILLLFSGARQVFGGIQDWVYALLAVCGAVVVSQVVSVVYDKPIRRRLSRYVASRSSAPHTLRPPAFDASQGK